MPKRYVTLAWIAAACVYLLIVLGFVVRITGSGLGCGNHWPLCNGRLFPPLGDPGAVIEWSHRLVAGVVSILIVALAVLDWRRSVTLVGLLVIQIALGAVTVKTDLQPLMVILHLATAMLLLAALIVAARGLPGSPGLRPGSAVLLALTFITVLFGALTANLGATAACHGFPLCNGQIVPQGGWLPAIHWTHRLLAYTLTGYVIWWAARSRDRAAWRAVAIVVAQIAIAVTMLNLGFANGLRAAHAAVGAGVWVAMLFVSLKPATDPAAVVSASPGAPTPPDTR
jgi:cytochrome c oxidase assembly protein subunit 15